MAPRHQAGWRHDRRFGLGLDEGGANNRVARGTISSRRKVSHAPARALIRPEQEKLLGSAAPTRRHTGLRR